MLRALIGGIAALVVSWSLGLAPAAAEEYPSRPITLIVPFPAGGPSDSIARVVADKMQASLGVRIAVENVTGASGSIGVGRAVHAAPDGYTLSFGTWSTHVINGALLPLQYDLLKDFEPVALVSDNPLVIVSNKSVPANNVKELVAWLRSHPGKATSGTAGLATPPSLAGLFFQQTTRTDFQLVHYRGVGPAMQDLLAGRIELMFDFVANALPQIRAGNIKAYAVLSKARLASLPDVPTVDEAGLPGFYVSSWQAMWAPKGTPASTIAKLNRAAVDALTDPAVQQRLRSLAQDTFPRDQLSPEALGKLQKAEIEKWWPIIQASNLKTH
jgi:tripartite-type tricarboxylate transporter receptor subunit TctC